MATGKRKPRPRFMTEEERNMRRRKDISFAIIMACLITIFIFISFAAGYFMGVKTTARYFAEMAAVFIKSTDIKITANLSLNETKLVDYMFEKSRNTTAPIQQKEYVIPCKMDPSIPRGETTEGIRCIQQQEVKD